MVVSWAPFHFRYTEERAKATIDKIREKEYLKFGCSPEIVRK